MIQVRVCLHLTAGDLSQVIDEQVIDEWDGNFPVVPRTGDYIIRATEPSTFYKVIRVVLVDGIPKPLISCVTDFIDIPAL